MPRPAHMNTAIVALVLAVSLSGARAEQFTVCTVMKTSDGFAALREKPSRDAKMIVKMLPGEIVDMELRNGKVIKQGKWFRIAHFPGVEMPNPGDPGYEKVRRGWAHGSVFDECG
ncbi:MAG TPA: hypothetical protein PKW21_04960 [Rhabdaerophilum sp.]|nr:hypothetical protein [Rhabdaerophilum sp.]